MSPAEPVKGLALDVPSTARGAIPLVRLLGVVPRNGRRRQPGRGPRVKGAFPEGILADSGLSLPCWLIRREALRTCLLLGVVVLLLTLVPSEAHAAEPRSGDTIIVGPNEVISDDLYAFGSTVEIQGTVRGDVIAFGNSVTVSGTVMGDLIAAGATVAVPGRVDGSLRAAGATVSVNGAVGEEVVAAARSLNVGRNSTIGRDLLIASESALVDGTVGRRLTASAGSLTLAGTVNGDVQAEVANLTIGSTAVVGGNLIYTSDNQASIAQGAQIRGSIRTAAARVQPSHGGHAPPLALG